MRAHAIDPTFRKRDGQLQETALPAFYHVVGRLNDLGIDLPSVARSSAKRLRYLKSGWLSTLGDDAGGVQATATSPNP